MRWLVFLGVMLMGGGCSSDPGGCTKDSDCKGSRVCSTGQCVDTGSGGGVPTMTDSGAGGTPAECDGQGDCQACIECAGDSTCYDAQQTCITSPDCTGLLDCLSACGLTDDVCQGGCYAGFPDSATADLSAYEVCVDCACSMDCVSCP